MEKKKIQPALRCHREDFQLCPDAPSNTAEGDRLRLLGSQGEGERRGERWREEEGEEDLVGYGVRGGGC